MMTMPMTNLIHSQPDRDALNQRFQGIAWAIFLIMSGVIWLLPSWLLPDGLWMLGTGFVLLGLNVARALHDIETSGFTVTLGLLALIGGLGNLMSVSLPIVPALLIGSGVLIILRAWQQRG
ncbi:hypothetical protein GC175_02135 [bacterium]|nr:hypothetical protein [bacterium]